MEKINQGRRIEKITEESFESENQRLSRLIWEGSYQEALPLADQILEFRTAQGDRVPALVQHASNYYSAATRSWKEKGMKAAPEVGRP